MHIMDESVIHIEESKLLKEIGPTETRAFNNVCSRLYLC